MALAFTDPQIKTLTQGVLDAPTIIASLTNDKNNMIAQKAKYLADDQANEVYTNNWHNIISQYHTELKYLNGQDRVTYDLADIDPAGRLLDPNIHFPSSPIWVGFQPKKDPSNDGNPIGTWTNTEQDAITKANTSLGLLKTGWTDGAGNTTTTAAFVVDEVDVTSAAGFSVGNRVLFTSASNYLYGTIDTITGLKLKIILISANAGFGGIASGATVKNFHPGFNLAQRESGVGATPAESAFMVYLKSEVDARINDWETRLNAEKTALLANDAIAPEAAEISAAATTVDGYLTTIATWEGFPSIGVGTSRFGTNLPPLEAALAARPAEFAARAAQIISRLGSVTQAGDGSYSGAGHYFNLFDNLNSRLNKGGGTLRNFYNSDLGIGLFDNMITNAQNQADRDAATFTIQQLSADANGTSTVNLVATTGLLVGDTVKVMSVTQPVITTTIISISGLQVVLGTTIPSTYKAGEFGRVVKQN